MITLSRNTPYTDRNEAGEVLGREVLEHLRFSDSTGSPMSSRDRTPPGRRAPVLVLGLCRGGVPVARAVAQMLNAPFDFCIVKKLSTDLNPELAIGALVESRTREAIDGDGLSKSRGVPEKSEPPSRARDGMLEVLNRDILAHLGDADAAVAASRAREAAELRRRVALYRKHKPLEPLEGKRVIIVDDGAATGTTMKAAIASARNQGAREIIVALPVAPEEVCAELRAEADAVICPWTPEYFVSVGSCYVLFPQVQDDEVCEAVSASRDKSQQQGTMK